MLQDPSMRQQLIWIDGRPQLPAMLLVEATERLQVRRCLDALALRDASRTAAQLQHRSWLLRSRCAAALVRSYRGLKQRIASTCSFSNPLPPWLCQSSASLIVPPRVRTDGAGARRIRRHAFLSRGVTGAAVHAAALCLLQCCVMLCLEHGVLPCALCLGLGRTAGERLGERLVEGVLLHAHSPSTRRTPHDCSYTAPPPPPPPPRAPGGGGAPAPAPEGGPRGAGVGGCVLRGCAPPCPHPPPAPPAPPPPKPRPPPPPAPPLPQRCYAAAAASHEGAAMVHTLALEKAVWLLELLCALGSVACLGSGAPGAAFLPRAGCDMLTQLPFLSVEHGGAWVRCWHTPPPLSPPQLGGTSRSSSSSSSSSRNSTHRRVPCWGGYRWQQAPCWPAWRRTLAALRCAAAAGSASCRRPRRARCTRCWPRRRVACARCSRSCSGCRRPARCLFLWRGCGPWQRSWGPT